MKITIILISNNFAGMEKSTHYLIKELSLLNMDVSLIINDELSPFYSDIKRINIYPIGSLSIKNRILNRLSLMKMSKKLTLLINSINPDIINLQSDSSAIAYAHTIKCQKIPIVTSLHGSDLFNFVKNKSLGYLVFTKPLVNKILNESTFLICVGQNQITDLKEKWKKKASIINCGVDSKLFRPKNIIVKDSIVTFAGRYIELKGIRELLNVAKSLPKYEFWFAGMGSLNNMIKGENIKNFGFKTSKELVKLYNRSTICVFPSHRESFGLVGLEAMACGKPVIATPAGFSEFITHKKDGIIIPAKNEEALKEAIVMLINNPKLRVKIGRNARVKALKYSWTNFAKQYLKVFKQAMSENRK